MRTVNSNWEGGAHNVRGYRYIHAPKHTKATKKGYVLEHRLVAEQSLGRHLPEDAVVHHVNGNRLDNRKENLVICENEPYHHLLHQRKRALRICGHANWRM